MDQLESIRFYLNPLIRSGKILNEQTRDRKYQITCKANFVSEMPMLKENLQSSITSTKRLINSK